ncbi:hypothetical protein ACFLT7_03470 [candidate division KSB1 bacterium]
MERNGFKPILAGICCLLTLPTISYAGELAGIWKPDNSDMHERAGTDCCSTLYRKLEIEEKDGKIVIKESVLMAKQFLDNESIYKTDGSESVNKGWNGREEMSKAVWKEGELIITTYMKVRKRTMETQTTFSLSDDGKILTMLKQMKNPKARYSEKFTFIKTE